MIGSGVNCSDGKYLDCRTQNNLPLQVGHNSSNSDHRAHLRQLRQGHPMRDVLNERVSEGEVPLLVHWGDVCHMVGHGQPGTRQHALPKGR